MKKRFVIIGSIVLTVATLLTSYVLRTQASRRLSVEPQSTQELGVAATSAPTSLQKSGHVETTTRPVTKMPMTNSAQEIVGILLKAKPGRLTTSQAHYIVKELIGLPDFDHAVRPLLASAVLSDRLIAVYAFLEKDGFTGVMRDMALSDKSPYVRAEIADWLFRKQEFSTLDSLMGETAAQLSPESVASLVSLAARTPKAEVPMALSRLDLGEGLPNYLTLVAERSAALTAAIADSLGNALTSAPGKKLMLHVLTSIRPPEYERVIEDRLQTEATLSTRTLLAQHLAASISETNSQARTRIESRLPQQPGLEPVALQYRESRVSRLHELDRDLRDLSRSGQPDPMRLQIALVAYLETGRLLGPGYLSAATLTEVTEFAAKNSVSLQDNSLSEARFEVRRIQGKTGTQ